MITQNINIILYVTGAITACMILMFIAPKLFMKKGMNLTLRDEAGVFFAQHWGLLVFLFGALIFLSAVYPEIRKPVLIAASIEKIAIVIMVLLNLKKDFVRGMFPAAVIDSVCVILYILYLTGAA
jgi:hypothetical protein